MAKQIRYHNPEHVIFQTLSSETVIINLQNGRYYSLNPTASEIWERVMHRASADEITSALTRTTAGDPTVIGKAVAAFLEQLVREDLVTEDPQATAISDPTPAVLTNQATFTPPELTIYSDMERLVPLDPPIHQYSKDDWKKATETD